MITMEDLKSHGCHVKLNGTTYITPMCCEHNISDKGDFIVLKEGTILVKEVGPMIIDEE